MTRKRLAVVLSTTLAIVAMLAISATAVHAITQTATLDVEGVDIYQFQCTSSLTHCMQASVCDFAVSSSDTWEVTLAVYSPTTLLGRGDTDLVHATGSGGCTSTVEVCRPNLTHGVMKAFVSVNHPDGVGNYYTVTVDCRDVSGALLPDANTKLTIKTNQ
jgi:hypothetical protein